MKISINRLTLQNFKGIKALEINADGENLKIFGDNATGKTTVFDAFTWVLFGKDSLGRSDFGIKTQDAYGNTIHNLEHMVECELSVDESILTLKKVYAEKWTKKRGSSEAEFSGHETKYFINEVPSTKKEYEQKIAMYIDESLFKTITNPLHFNEHLKWQERRATLLSLCEGNMSDVDILGRSPEFLPLLNELKGRTVTSDVIHKSYEFNQPVYTGGEIEQLFTVSNHDIIVESVKKAEDSDAVIIRMYESKGGETETAVCFNKPVESVHIVDLMEENEEEVNLGTVKFHKFEIITLKVEM